MTRLKDQSEMWVPLHQLKEFNTVQLTLFAQVMGVADIFWMDALTKEITDIHVAFHILDCGESPPLGTRKHQDTWFGM